MDSKTKEGIYWLQRIDCNCNDCGFMKRDLTAFKFWEDWHRAQEFAIFEKQKTKAITDAKAIQDEKARGVLLAKADKMKFHFEKANLLNYGLCGKFGKPVTFIPNTCQIQTQDCFIHRKDYSNAGQ